MVEKICDLDDDLMEQYLEGTEPSVEDLKKAAELFVLCVKIVSAEKILGE